MSENKPRPRAAQREFGKLARHQVPRQSHAAWHPAANRLDPVALLQAQDANRIKELLPIKYGRMVASPFAFMRGSAVVMAADLAHTPDMGSSAQLCGDAHLSNFGLYGSPERELVFDINDFDETNPGPWEWDLKRLVASAVVAGRENGFSHDTNHALVKETVKAYARVMRKLSRATTLAVWYFHVKARTVQDAFQDSSRQTQSTVVKTVHKAMSNTEAHTLEKLTEVFDGRRRIVSAPPLIVSFGDLLPKEVANQISRARVEQMWSQYLDSLPVERRLLLSRFQIADAALRVGGIGSVGTFCFIMLLEGAGDNDAIILQQKQAGSSVLEAYTAPTQFDNSAARVVHGQRLMQASSDIFLGWHRGDMTGTYYYWRQLKDMKGSFDVLTLDATGLKTYLRICAASLARAHARTGEPAAISAYIGRGKRLGEAFAEFAAAYADQTERDHAVLVTAVRERRVVAQEGV